MRFPRSEADPAKVVFASLAHHVIAAAVLLNRRLTLGTFLPAKSHFSVTTTTKITRVCLDIN